MSQKQIEKIDVLITEPCADWFKNVWVELDPSEYTYFKLLACEMRWDLLAYLPKKSFTAQEVYETFPLAPGFNAKKLIGKIDIREIIGNHYIKPADLLIKK